MKTSMRRTIHGQYFAGIVCALAIASPALALNIAVTNDDGWDSPGIQALRAALEADGHAVVVAAPLDGQSGSSAALNIASNLVVTRQTVNEFSVALAGGTEGAEPASSALIAIDISNTLNGSTDLLISGINSGANVGAAAQISGTVGATIVAIANGLNGTTPAIGISTDEPCDVDDPPGGDLAACEAANAAHYADVGAFVADFVAHLETKPGFLGEEAGLLPAGVSLNINYPPLPPEQIQGVKLATQGRTLILGGSPLNLIYRCFACGLIPVGASSPGGIGGVSFDPTPDVAGSDSAAVDAGFIAVVPFEPDYTARPGLHNSFNSVLNGFEE
jgi:5'/3'-nucleotidase SurE